MYQYRGASRRKGSRDSDGQNNHVEVARGSSRQITISARIQWKNLVKNKVSIIWRQGPQAPVSALEAGFSELRLQWRMNVQICSSKGFSTFDGHLNWFDFTDDGALLCDVFPGEEIFVCTGVNASPRNNQTFIPILSYMLHLNAKC